MKLSNELGRDLKMRLSYDKNPIDTCVAIYLYMIQNFNFKFRIYPNTLIIYLNNDMTQWKIFKNIAFETFSRKENGI